MWERKLKNTKVVLKEWVKHSQTNPVSERHQALEKLEEIQLEMEELEITSSMLEKEKQAQFNSFLAFKQEEEYWRLKSRSTWLKAGDRNTSFFTNSIELDFLKIISQKFLLFLVLLLKDFLKLNKLLNYISRTCTKKMDSLILI